MSRRGATRLWSGIFLCLLAARMTFAQDPAVRLISEATVNSENIWLSDLLPSSAGPAMLSEARAIYLGHAPEPASFRVFTAAQLESAAHGKIEIEAAEYATVHRLGWPLNPERVRGIMSSSGAARGLDLSGGKLLLPLGFVTLTPDPELEVVHAGRSSDRTFVARMRCRTRANCASFSAQMFFEDPLPSETRSVKIAFPALASSGAVQFTRLKSAVQPGRPAWLLIESDGMRIRERVFPLRRARLG